MGKPARADLDRSGNPRHRAEHLHPQGREGRRRTLQRRIRDLRGRQGRRQDEEVTLQDVESAVFCVAPSTSYPCLSLSSTSFFEAVVREDVYAPVQASLDDLFPFLLL